jgi:hypothetical protein
MAIEFNISGRLYPVKSCSYYYMVVFSNYKYQFLKFGFIKVGF